MQKFIKKNAIDFCSAQANGPLGPLAARVNFNDNREDLDIMNNQTDDGLFVSSAYDQMKKILASADSFKLLMSELDQSRENEI